MSFSGKALYDAGVFSDELAEDVAPLVGMISPSETPLLDYLGDPQYAAQNILHEWAEDQLAPNSVITSTAVSSSTADTAVQVLNGEGSYLMPGAILTSDLTGEYFQIVTVGANTIVLSRGWGGTTTTSSLGTGATLQVVSDAANEGADVATDISRARPRKHNTCQIFKKDLIISGSTQAVRKVGGVNSEFDYQQRNRAREALRDLEKAVIRGVLANSPSGGAAMGQQRTMRGLWQAITTNVHSVATITESWLGNAIKSAWDYGARDLDLIVCDANYKRVIDSWNATRIRTNPNDTTFRNLITEYEGTFGTHRVILSRWMKANSAMVLASQRIQVMPLVGRSFAYVPIAPTGDASKGMVIGEYTIEYKNEEGLAKVHAG